MFKEKTIQDPVTSFPKELQQLLHVGDIHRYTAHLAVWGDEVWTLGINRLTFFGGMKSPKNYSMVRIKGWTCLNPPTSHGWNIKWCDDGSWWLMVKQASTGLLPLVSVHHALNGMQHQRHVAEEIEFSWWSQPQGYQRIIPTPHHCMACLKMGENQNCWCHN